MRATILARGDATTRLRRKETGTVPISPTPGDGAARLRRRTGPVAFLAVIAIAAAGCASEPPSRERLDVGRVGPGWVTDRYDAGPGYYIRPSYGGEPPRRFPSTDGGLPGEDGADRAAPRAGPSAGADGAGAEPGAPRVRFEQDGWRYDRESCRYVPTYRFSGVSGEGDPEQPAPDGFRWGQKIDVPEPGEVEPDPMPPKPEPIEPRPARELIIESSRSRK